MNEIFRVLNRIIPIDINRGKFHLSLSEIWFLFLNERINEINKKIPAMGNAEGRKNIPIKKNWLPKSRLL